MARPLIADVMWVTDLSTTKSKLMRVFLICSSLLLSTATDLVEALGGP